MANIVLTEEQKEELARRAAETGADPANEADVQSIVNSGRPASPTTGPGSGAGELSGRGQATGPLGAGSANPTTPEEEQRQERNRDPIDKGPSARPGNTARSVSNSGLGTSTQDQNQQNIRNLTNEQVGSGGRQPGPDIEPLGEDEGFQDQQQQEFGGVAANVPMEQQGAGGQQGAVSRGRNPTATAPTSSGSGSGSDGRSTQDRLGDALSAFSQINIPKQEPLPPVTGLGNAAQVQPILGQLFQQPLTLNRRGRR